MTLQDKKVVVIGGSAGIGKATAQAAAAAGAHVVIAGRSEEQLQKARTEIGGRIEQCVLDVRDVRGMDYCLEEVAPFDHLVITAADVHTAPFLKTDLEEAHQMFEVKFWGQLAAVQLAAPCIREGGSITLFSGAASRKPMQGYAMIAAMNGAIEGLMRTLAVELSPIRVNAVSPGLIDTHNFDPERRQAVAQRLPVKQIGEPSHVAAGVLFLMQNPYVTGTVLCIDGGSPLV